MRKIKEVLRLKFEAGLSNRRNARSCGISRTAVAEYLSRFEEAGLSWPAAAELDDAGQARVVADYVAGMTDRYAIAEHERLL